MRREQSRVRPSDLHFDGLIVDLDGVVWIGATAVSRSVAAIARLRADGVRLVFMTNDPRASRAAYAARLRGLGIAASENEVVTSGSTLASVLRKRERAGATAFVIGSPSLKAELAGAGLEILPGEAGRNAEVVAVGGHEAFDYHELRIAIQAVRRGGRLYAAGRDATFPMPDGPWPGTGSIVAAVEVGGGTRAITVGKPEPAIFDVARSLLAGCGRIAIVGDNLEADIAGGNRAGLTTILVLTGTSKRDDIAGGGVVPDIVLPDLAAVIDADPESSDTAAPPDVAEVRRIGAIENPVIRNLEITECYSQLAAGMATRAPGCSNWCTYATWASRQAGSTIRGEDMLQELARLLGRDAELAHPLESAWRWLLRRGLFQRKTWLGRLTAELHTPFDAFERASAAVADGNRKVFDEIGLHFARYLDEIDSSVGVDSPEFERFLEGFAPGEPPDGQRYLRQAFTRYQRQRAEADPKRRTEVIVLANLEIGMHEQTRLQPQIRRALDAAIPEHDLGWRLLRRSLQRQLSKLSREVITHSLMVLTLPGTVLALGRNLDAPFPEELRAPDDPELVAMLARYEPVPPALDDCGAEDWSQLPQRMHYISHLFRVFHHHAELASAPFTPEQVALFRSGAVPEGDL